MMLSILFPWSDKTEELPVNLKIIAIVFSELNLIELGTYKSTKKLFRLNSS